MSATKFEAGKTYSTRSIVDYDTVMSFEIVSRTAKTVTFKARGKLKRRGIFLYAGVEQFKPHGSYSMCAIVGADDLSN